MRAKNGLVLAGAAALGAYEAGVVRYIARELAADLDRPAAFDVISGTSAGAINAAGLAAMADRAAAAAGRVCQLWSRIRLGQVLRPSAIDALSMVLDATGSSGCLPTWSPARARARGGLIDAAPIERLIRDHMALDRLDQQLRSGRLCALALAATHVASGRSVVFYQAAAGCPPWPTGRLARAVPTRIRTEHVMASAAIPLLFPAVTIDGEAYCDGGLRQLVPLAPAIHLGAERLLIISPLPVTDDAAGPVRRRSLASPVYLAGKALNALLVDRVEADLERLDQLNGVLAAGARRYGPRFVADLAAELRGAGAAPLRPVEALRLSPSRDLGRMAAEYASTPEFARRERGAAGRVLRRLAAGDPERSGDLLAYLLFDGRFAAQLIDLGAADARARHDQLLGLFADDAPAAGISAAGPGLC